MMLRKNVTETSPEASHNDTESSTIEGGNKNGLGGATNTKTLGLATSLDPTKNDKETTTAMVPQNKWATEDSDFAIFFLETAQRDYEHALFMRTYYAKNARKHGDRKSTRLNSSHVSISYAVLCLKKK